MDWPRLSWVVLLVLLEVSRATAVRWELTWDVQDDLLTRVFEASVLFHVDSLFPKCLILWDIFMWPFLQWGSLMSWSRAPRARSGIFSALKYPYQKYQCHTFHPVLLIRIVTRPACAGEMGWGNEFHLLMWVTKRQCTHFWRSSSEIPHCLSCSLGLNCCGNAKKEDSLTLGD